LNEAESNYSLVLIGRYPGKDFSVAQALARCMGREESWGLRIVSSAPIIFFEKLSDSVARKLHETMTEVANAGCRFEIQHGSNASLPKIGWANPPRIYGLSMEEIAQGSNLFPAAITPVNALPSIGPNADLGGVSRHSVGVTPVYAAGSVQSRASAPQAPLPAANDPYQTFATIYLPCPYTGQKLKLTLHMSISRVDGAAAVNIASAAVQPAGVSGPNKSPLANSGTVILPGAQIARATGAVSLPKNSGAVTTQARNASPSIEAAGYSLTPPVASNAITRPPSGANTQPAAWTRRTPNEIPLPDVPVLPLASFGAQVKAAETQREHMPLNRQPMDLETFEEKQIEIPASSPRPPSDRATVKRFNSSSGTELAAILAESQSSGEEVLCSVYIERSSSPVVHALVAELHGIPESEAAEMCFAGRTALAENIPLVEAVDIKRRCAAINVNARIVTQT
jgi:hypothetical protein